MLVRPTATGRHIRLVCSHRSYEKVRLGLPSLPALIAGYVRVAAQLFSRICATGICTTTDVCYDAQAFGSTRET